MQKSWKIAIIGIFLLACLLGCMTFITEAQDTPNNIETMPPVETSPQEEMTEPSLPDESVELPALQHDLPTYIKLPVERPVETVEEPDVIKVKVRLYNDHAQGFNPVDGAAYIYDIAAMLHKYAPEGLHISAGCAMAYTEGGSGKQGVYTATNNCFGIRATSKWDGWVYARNQGKVYKDYQTAVANGGSDFFCAYPTMEESVMHYVRLVSGSYYNGAFQYESDRDYLAYILSKGYGEEGLLDTWLSLIRMYNTTQYNF